MRPPKKRHQRIFPALVLAIVGIALVPAGISRAEDAGQVDPDEVLRRVQDGIRQRELESQILARKQLRDAAAKRPPTSGTGTSPRPSTTPRHSNALAAEQSHAQDGAETTSGESEGTQILGLKPTAQDPSADLGPDKWYELVQDWIEEEWADPSTRRNLLIAGGVSAAGAAAYVAHNTPPKLPRRKTASNICESAYIETMKARAPGATSHFSGRPDTLLKQVTETVFAPVRPPLRAIRDSITSALTKLRDDRFPAVVFDNGTREKSGILSRSFYPERVWKEDAAYPASDIIQEVKAHIDYVKAYPKNVRELIDREAQLRAQIAEMESALKEMKKLPRFRNGSSADDEPFTFQLTEIKDGAEIRVQKTVQDPDFLDGLLSQARLDLKRLQSTREENVDSYRMRARFQALSIQTLKFYRNELRDQMARDADGATPQALTELLTQIEEAIGRNRVPNDYAPPEYAYQWIKWKQMRTEVGTAYDTSRKIVDASGLARQETGPIHPDQFIGAGDGMPTGGILGHGGGAESHAAGDAPALESLPTPGSATPPGQIPNNPNKPNTRSADRLANFIQQIVASNKDPYNYNRIGAHANLLRYTTGGAALTAIGSTALALKDPLIDIPVGFYKWMQDSRSAHRSQCAHSASDTDYATCLEDHLKRYYTASFINYEERGMGRLFVKDPEGKVDFNRSIKRELSTIAKLREEYQTQKQRGANLNESLVAHIGDTDVASDEYMNRAYLAPIDVFKDRLSKRLQFKYGFEYDEALNKIVMEVVDKDGTGESAEALSSLQKKSDRIFNDVNFYLTQRMIQQTIGGGIPTGIGGGGIIGGGTVPGGINTGPMGPGTGGGTRHRGAPTGILDPNNINY